MDWTMATIAAEAGQGDIGLAVPVLYLVEAAWGLSLTATAHRAEAGSCLK
jgi:hypothetical protein